LHSPIPPSAKLHHSVLALLTCFALISSGCGTPGSGVSSQPSTASQTKIEATSSTPILLFAGTGTIANDVSAVEAMLTSMKLGYATVTTSQLDAMSQTQLEAYKLLIVPGGNSITIGDNLSTTATTNIHNAVTVGGLHYFGICAGAFFGGYSIYNGLNLTSGTYFDTYANGGHGTGKTAVEVTYPGGTELDQYWQDGPELDGWGDIVAKYPDGTSAIVEGASGKGWVLLSGIHAEAPSSWREGMTFTTTVAVDNAYFETMVTAALAGTTLPHY
jgi:glutamine amidotransferase-like uncharacterized protein